MWILNTKQKSNKRKKCYRLASDWSECVELETIQGKKIEKLKKEQKWFNLRQKHVFHRKSGVWVDNESAFIRLSDDGKYGIVSEQYGFIYVQW